MQVFENWPEMLSSSKTKTEAGIESFISRVPVWRAAPRLRRVGRDHLHSQFLHGPAGLRGTLVIDLAAALRSQPEMGSAVRIQRTEEALLFDHCP